MFSLGWLLKLIAIGLYFGSYVPTVELNNTIQLFESNKIDELIQIIIQIFKLQFAFRLEYHCILLGIIGFKLCYPQKGEIKMNCQMKLKSCSEMPCYGKHLL
jgi:hypothetical protein